MRVTGSIVFLMVGLMLGCAGPAAPPPPLVVRVDYSHVDGASCMSAAGRPSLAWKKEWDLSACTPRSAGPEGLSDACRAAYNAECCTQIGGTMIAWEMHQEGSEKLASPLCKL